MLCSEAIACGLAAHQNTCSSLRPKRKCALAASVVLGLGGHQTGPRPFARYGSLPGGTLGAGGTGAAMVTDRDTAFQTDLRWNMARNAAVTGRVAMT